MVPGQESKTEATSGAAETPAGDKSACCSGDPSGAATSIPKAFFCAATSIPIFFWFWGLLTERGRVLLLFDLRWNLNNPKMTKKSCLCQGHHLWRL